MNGYVLVINDMGIRHIITTSDYNAKEFAEHYYEDFCRFESDVFIFVSGTMQQAQMIAELFSFGWKERKNERRKAD